MALGEAILICLTERPMSGYELAKTFDTSIGFFWQADHQQIYRQLAKLRDKGLVESEEVIQSGRPNKLVYEVTEAGRKHLREWSLAPTKPAPVKDDLLVRLYAVEAVDLAALRRDLMERLEAHRDRLAQFERILHRNFEGRPLSTAEKGKLLGLEIGLRYERNWSEWCQDALDLLPRDGEGRDDVGSLALIKGGRTHG